VELVRPLMLQLKDNRAEMARLARAETKIASRMRKRARARSGPLGGDGAISPARAAAPSDGAQLAAEGEGEGEEDDGAEENDEEEKAEKGAQPPAAPAGSGATPPRRGAASDDERTESDTGSAV
jgi:hypothetical protein